ncbi:MAG TPA: hypothetical protein VF011_02790 [Terriglobales bacterium]
MENKEFKSQLAKDLESALFMCRLVDDLSELVDDKTITDKRVKSAIRECYIKATVLLACAIVDSKDLQNVMGHEK